MKNQHVQQSLSHSLSSDGNVVVPCAPLVLSTHCVVWEVVSTRWVDRTRIKGRCNSDPETDRTRIKYRCNSDPRTDRMRIKYRCNSDLKTDKTRIKGRV